MTAPVRRSNSSRRWAWFAALSAGLAAPAGTAAPPSAGTLTLSTCIDHALMENLNLRVRRFDPGIAQEGVTMERAAFDPHVDVSGSLSESKAAAASSELEGSSQPTTEQRGGAVTLSKQWLAGTQTRLASLLNERDTDSSFSTLNPVDNAEIQLSVSQPLLRDRGALVNGVDIARAEIAVVGAREQLRAAALDLVRDVEYGYWELALALEQLSVADRAVALSEQLLAEARARFDRGMNTRADVLWAEADVVSKREAVLVSNQQIADARDRLLVLMNDLQPDTQAGFTTEPIPEELPARPDVEAAVQTALERQPEFRLLQDRRRVDALDHDVALAQRLPSLDLNGRIGAGGLSDNPGEALQGMADRDGHQWAVDLTLRMPWGLRREHAMVRQSGYELMQSDLRIAEARLQLTYDIRAACRSVETGIERIGVTRKARDMQELRMNQARAQYQAGLAVIRDVMDAQDDYNAAHVRVLAAIRGTIQAMVRLGRLEGSLLDAHGIAWRVVEMAR